MRSLPIVLALFLTLLAPVRAHAWFGFLDYLSGPGPFKGALYDVRLVCIGKPFTATRTIESAVARALRASLAVAAVSPVPSDRATDAVAAWKAVANAIEAGQTAYPVLPEEERQAAKAGVEFVIRNLRILARTDTPRTQVGEPATAGDERVRAAAALPDATAKGVELALRQGQLLRTSNVAQNSVGTLVSLCPAEETRRLSIDVNVDFWQANSNGTWADDYTIRLIAMAPAVSYQPIKDPRHDYVDLSLSAGRYRFSSRGFDTFSGWIVQPRVDVHFPTVWLNQGGVRRTLALFTGRFGYTNFPQGIEAAQFANPDVTRAVSGKEWTKGAAVFFNMTPFLRRRSVVPSLSEP